jgi:hypothetical protein
VSTKADVLTPQERQVAHDLLVKAMSPEDKAGHSCDMCTPGLEAHAVTALTQDDLDKAVAAAAAPLTAKIADLESQLGQRQADDSVAQAVADAIEPLNKQISELQTALDTELVARKAADDQVTELTDMINTAGAEADKAARRSSRVEAVKDTGVYPDETFDESVAVNKERIDRWCDMDDATFDVLVDGWKIAKPAKPAGNGPLPSGRSAITDTVAPSAPAGDRSAATRKFFDSLTPSAS